MADCLTIFALSSGRPPSGVAVVRISGPSAVRSLVALAGSAGEPRRARLVTLRDPASGEPLDRALVLRFEVPASATGEDVAELHLHGGRAVIAAVLSALAKLPGLRLAEPGEFTRRAFANGVMDLAAVEGLADLIAADTEAQRRQALRQAEGALGRAVAGWRDRLVRAMALVEAAIDFPDEGDVPADLLTPARAQIAALAADMRDALADAGRGERVRDGLVVAIAGPPNAGKSSLLNALAKRDVAIVSDVPGTTRDALELHLNLAGIAVTLVDTAGLRDSADPVEAEGVRRARRRIENADLVLWLEDLSAEAPPPPPQLVAAWRIGTKADVARAERGERRHLVSALTGLGLPDLLADLTGMAGGVVGGEPALVTRARHVAALAEAAVALEAAAARVDDAPDVMAEDLRQAARGLGRVVGAVDVEDVLDALFREFCIGK